MNVTLERLRRDYLALLGESPGLSPELEAGEESGVLELEELLGVRLPPLAVEATLETPLLWLDEVESVSPRVTWQNDVGRIPLPDDYLRLYSLLMSGWSQPVDHPESRATLRGSLGTRCPSWMACQENPLVMEERDESGKFLTVKGVAGRPESPLQLLYVPLPHFTEKKLRISAAAYPRLLEKLVKEAPY